MKIRKIDWNEINSCNNCKETKEWAPEENVWMPDTDFCDEHDPDLDPNGMYKMDKAEEKRINDMDNSQERFDVTLRGDLYDVTDYFDDSEDSTLYSGVVVELVGQWFHVDPIGASKWVQNQREQAKPEQLKLHLGG